MFKPQTKNTQIEKAVEKALIHYGVDPDTPEVFGAAKRAGFRIWKAALDQLRRDLKKRETREAAMVSLGLGDLVKLAALIGPIKDLVGAMQAYNQNKTSTNRAAVFDRAIRLAAAWEKDKPGHPPDTLR